MLAGWAEAWVGELLAGALGRVLQVQPERLRVGLWSGTPSTPPPPSARPTPHSSVPRPPSARLPRSATRGSFWGPNSPWRR